MKKVFGYLTMAGIAISALGIWLFQRTYHNQLDRSEDFECLCDCCKHCEHCGHCICDCGCCGWGDGCCGCAECTCPNCEYHRHEHSRWEDEGGPCRPGDEH